MNAFKKYSSTLSSAFDSFVRKFENHEALVNAAICEMQKSNAKMYMQTNRVKRDARIIEQRLEELKAMELSWTDRATRSAHEDRDRALECLRRKKAVRLERIALETQQAEQSSIVKKLEEEAKKIEQRLQELKRKKHTLTAKQYQSEAFGYFLAGQGDVVVEIDEIFERWEQNLAGAGWNEFEAETDELKASFESEEERVSLNGELDLLVPTAEIK